MTSSVRCTNFRNFEKTILGICIIYCWKEERKGFLTSPKPTSYLNPLTSYINFSIQQIRQRTDLKYLPRGLSTQKMSRENWIKQGRDRFVSRKKMLTNKVCSRKNLVTKNFAHEKNVSRKKIVHEKIYLLTKEFAHENNFLFMKTICSRKKIF